MGSGQWNSCNALPHCLGAVGSATRAMRGPTSWGDGESCPRGGRCLWRAYGRWQPPSARAHQLGGCGVLPRRRSVPLERLRGTAAPIGTGPPAGGTGSPAQVAVAVLCCVVLCCVVLCCVVLCCVVLCCVVLCCVVLCCVVLCCVVLCFFLVAFCCALLCGFRVSILARCSCFMAYYGLDMWAGVSHATFVPGAPMCYALGPQWL